ncbi:MAG: hypothetical protein ACOYB3_14210 [Azonexus sp.]
MDGVGAGFPSGYFHKNTFFIHLTILAQPCFRARQGAGCDRNHATRVFASVILASFARLWRTMPVWAV